MRKRKLFCISLCIVAVLTLTACKGGERLPSESESDLQSTNTNSESTQENSNTPDTSSNTNQNDYVMDKAILNQISLEKDGLTELELMGASEGVECLTLFNLRSSDGRDVWLRELDITETGFVISLSHTPKTSDSPYYHYFWLDRQGNESDHVCFDLKDTIPDRDYPEKGFFKTTSEDGTIEARYYTDGKLQKSIQLPECRRASFTPDKSQYLCIDKERKNLTLYGPETKSAVSVLSVKDFDLEEPWVMDFVNVVTPKLATVTLLEYDADKVTDYHGDENLRTFLLELPTLRIIQQLPDGSELMVLDDENFLMTKQENQDRRISRAKAEDGKLTETETDFVIHNTTQFFNSANITLSPEKKIMLIRNWETNFDNGGAYMRCQAVSLDNLQSLWEIKITGEGYFQPDFYTPAAITDDAVLYLFGDSLNSGDDKPLYRVGMKK
ncbi:MAG: hypothetical protein ACI4JS_05155 [Oscillospiraceae bacterium]